MSTQTVGETRPQVEETDTIQTALSIPHSAMFIVGLGIFLAALDQTVIVTALWPISQEMAIPITELDKAAWVVTAYLLGYTVALPLMGRVADVYGQRRIFLVSLGVFMLGSVLCALAPTLGWLIAARGVQAVGGGAVLPVGMAMASHIYGAKRVPFMLGILGAVAEAGGVIGPLWGAAIMEWMEGLLKISGWRWIFWVNVPLGLVFAALLFMTP
jgi:MFS family permease